jgi:predicted transcriptional regulator of viral defense system
MTTTASDRLLELAGRRRLLRAADVREAGISPQLLIKLNQLGKLRRVARGVYSLPHHLPTEHHTLTEVCHRVPKAVVCLLSALQFHEIGTQQPFEVWIALPEQMKAPVITYPPLRVTKLRGRAFDEGIETVMDHGMPIRVYSPAKTIVDCFKFRNKIGLDVALEALKDAWGQRLIDLNDVNRYAIASRVERVMRPYLETMLA